MKHTISVLVENRFGAFNRVATMFSGRGFNVHSISIGETEDPEISRMTLVTSGDDQIIEQVVKQLNRLIDTIKIVDINNKTLTLEITGPPDKIDAAMNVLAQYGIKEIARSGTVALKRGEQSKTTVKISSTRKEKVNQ